MNVSGKLTYRISKLTPAGKNPDSLNGFGFVVSPEFEGTQGVVVTFGGSTSRYANQLRRLNGRVKTFAAQPGETEADVQARAAAFADAVVAEFYTRLEATGDVNDVRNIVTVAAATPRLHKLHVQPWQSDEE